MMPVAKLFFTPCNHQPQFSTSLFKHARVSPFQVPPPWKTVSVSTAMADTQKKPTTRVVEHIVLLKVKDGVTAQQQDFMVSGLRSLSSIQTVIELNAGKAVQVWGENFTHALHCRFISKEGLASYANDPFHLDVISKCIAPFVEDRLALDWEADLEEPTLQSKSYGAVRIAALKPKKDALELSDIMDMLRDYRSRFPSIKQVSVGKNFSPARAKGYEWAFLAIFPRPEELAELTKSEEHVSLQYEKVLPAMEKIAVLDYHTA
ncbi:hypothetical protein L7F22_033638 [Adiantum nelumboides]|nr:hypothetical protein [Adiantum nelumboides]